MEVRMIENNRVSIRGKITSDFMYSHEVLGERFYCTYLSSERKSGVKDTVPIMVSERLVDVKEDWKEKQVKVEGQFRSYNKHEEERNRLILSVFAREFEEVEELPFSEDLNSIYLEGYICKNPVYRETPLGREVADIMLAVNRPYGKSDYIPCIFWGRNARFVSSMNPGQRIKVYGRIQSREYLKTMQDGTKETRIAYEVSVSEFFLEEKGE